MAQSTVVPESFARAVAAMRSVEPRPEIVLEDITAPQGLAPYSFALGGIVARDGDEVATGRLVLLFDPAGQEAWGGTLRMVTYVTAAIEAELAADPLLPAVGWSWLTDALASFEAEYTAIGGTVTQTTSTRFGALAGPPSEADLEIRASWTPLSEDLAPHLESWCALLASTAGLPPPGVTALTDRLAQRG
jgi:Protein of unknown function (DUF3000)